MNGDQTDIYVFTGIVIILSIVFNGGIILHTAYNWKKLLFQEVLMLSLFCANFFQALFGYTLPIYVLLAEKSRSLSSQSHCMFNGYSMLSFAMISIFMITIMIGHRYYLIMKPFQAKMIKSRRFIALAISSIAWILGFLCALPPLISKTVAFQSLQHGHYCGLDWTNGSIENSFYIGFLIVLAYFFPISLYLYTYINGAHNLQISITSDRVHRSTKKYHVITILMLFFFLASWTPYSFAGFMALAKHPLSTRSEMICSMIAKMSSLWNSLLYFIIHITYFKCTNPIQMVNTWSLLLHQTGQSHIRPEELSLLQEDNQQKQRKVNMGKIVDIHNYAIKLAQNILDDVLKNLNVEKAK